VYVNIIINEIGQLFTYSPLFLPWDKKQKKHYQTFPLGVFANSNRHRYLEETCFIFEEDLV
jgi:hypothetical protein